MIKRSEQIEDPRRRFLVQALALGLIGGALPMGAARGQGFFGQVPDRLPKDRSIYRIRGTAYVNGAPADLRTRILPGDVVTTGADSEIVFVVGGHSMILRSNGRLAIEGQREPANPIIAALRMLTGRLLSVSRDSRLQVRTATATIGIRGTGFYAESDPEQTYFCNCYGTIDVASSADPSSVTTVVAEHHDRPLYILGDAPPGEAIRDAPFVNHTDEELGLIEALVGREPPFVFGREEYLGPRRRY